MKKLNSNQKEIAFRAVCAFFSLVIMYALVLIISYQKELEKLESVSPYNGSVFSTVQIWNDETGKWDTYQGYLDFDIGLYGEWKYEVNGLEAVLTGSRYIGSVASDGTGSKTELSEFAIKTGGFEHEK